MEVVGEDNGMIIFKKKLMFLKNKIKDWNKSRRKLDEACIKDLSMHILEIQNRILAGVATDDELKKRVDYIKQIYDIDHVQILDLAQRAKVRWE